MHFKITVHNNEPMVSSKNIAEQFDREHSHVMTAIRGILGGDDFVVGSYTDTQNQQRPMILLNERSALIAMPFIGGTKSKEGQIALVDTYLAYKNSGGYKIPQTYSQALALASKQAEVIENQKKTISLKDDYILASNEANIKAGEISIREFVKTNDAINIGGNKFISWMRENGIVFKESRQPKQQYVDNGWLTWKFSKDEYQGKKRRELKITPRGQLQLAKRYMIYRTIKLEALENALS